MTWLSSAALITMGVVLGTSTLPKIRRPYAFAAALVGYGVPRQVAIVLGPILITLEAAVAALCLTEFKPRMAAVGALGLFILYSAVVGWALLRGKNHVSCGCYAFGNDRSISWTLLVRNALASTIAIPPLMTGVPAANAAGWTLAALTAAYLTALIALVDELGAFYDRIHA